jgi:chromatin structure-remodeling complex protein RSC7
MADGDAEMVDEDRDATPQEDVVEDDEEEEEAATPAAEDDDDEDDEDATPTITTSPRRRGRGGRPRSRVGYGNGNTPDPGDDLSESGTPMRRRRGRPPGTGGGRGSGRGRGRGRGRGGIHSDAPRFIIDKSGRALDVVDDEALVDDDAEGNEKVDSKGHLQGGREYRVRTFTIMGKEERLYMLSTEPARCCGFRDSYLFFTKHPKLYKVVVGDEEKKDLIDRDILPNSYKGRNIGVVTARSVFREFGAKIIVGGRRITDDYKVTEARANGDVEGELADPDDHVPDAQEAYNRNRYVAWFGASDVYRASAGGGTMPHTKQSGQLKRRNNCTLQNWQFMHAREAR